MVTCRSSELAVVQGLYETNLQSIEGAQCYGHLSQYLDPEQLPWHDRLTHAPEALPAWRPAAQAWRALHDKCRAITTEVRMHSSFLPDYTVHIVM